MSQRPISPPGTQQSPVGGHGARVCNAEQPLSPDASPGVKGSVIAPPEELSRSAPRGSAGSRCAVAPCTGSSLEDDTAFPAPRLHPVGHPPASPRRQRNLTARGPGLGSRTRSAAAGRARAQREPGRPAAARQRQSHHPGRGKKKLGSIPDTQTLPPRVGARIWRPQEASAQPRTDPEGAVGTWVPGAPGPRSAAANHRAPRAGKAGGRG